MALIKISWFCLIIILAAQHLCISQTTFTSVIDGNWNDGATWGNASPGVQGTDWPASTDNTVIASGTTVSLTTLRTINNFTINFGGQFDYNANILTVSGIVTPFISKQTGNYTTITTWLNGASPAITDNVVIASGTTVSLVANTVMNDLSVNSGGVLDDNNNGTTTVNGNLLLNGTLFGKKDFHLTGGVGVTVDGTGVYDQKKFRVDGNASILSTANLSFFDDIDIQNNIILTNNGSVTISKKITGKNAGSTWINAAGSYLSAGDKLLDPTGVLIASALGNTVVYSGKKAQNIKNTAGSIYHNLVISGLLSKTLQAATTINGDLSIQGGILDTDIVNNYSLTVKGDWTNSSSFLAQAAIVTFSGTGSQSLINTAGDTFYDLVVDKTGSTMSMANNVVVSNSLTLLAGVINTGSNKLTLGTSTVNEGILVYTAGQVAGQFERFIASTTTATNIDFPVGIASNTRLATINFTGITTGGSLVFEFIEADPGSAGLSLTDGVTTIYNTFSDGYWDMSLANGFTLGANSFSLDLSGTGFTAFTISALTRLLTRPDAGSNWIAEGTHIAAVDPVAKRSGLSTMPAQYAFGDDTNCTAPTTSSITGTVEVCTSDTSVGYSVINTPGSLYTWTITGGTQASGGVTNSITVDWGVTGQVGNVRVVENNGCTNGFPVDFSVNINTIQPASITGRTQVAEFTIGEAYSVTAITGYTYTWTITGGTQASGGTTNSITVDWGITGTGIVSVVSQKSGCSAAPATSINVNKYNVINSVQTGNWNIGTTWETGVVPLTTESARILNTHTVTLTAKETINNFIIDVGGVLDAVTNNQTLKVEGDVKIDGTYNGGTKQLEFNGINTTIDGIGTISITGSDIHIKTGSKTISSTAVLTVSAGNFELRDAGINVTNNGSITIANSLTERAGKTTTWTNAVNSTLNVGVAISTTTFNASATGNLVNYNGLGAQIIVTPSSSTYYHLTLSGGGIKTAPAGNLNLLGNFTNNVTLANGAGTITLNGSTGQTIGGLSVTTTFNNLIINNTISGDAITLSVPVLVSGALTLTDGTLLSTAVNKLSMGPIATTSGFSNASFVDGPMTYNGLTIASVTFPIGKTSELHRVDIIMNGTISNYTAEYINSSAIALGFALPGTLDRVSDIGYWSISRDAGGSVTSATANLYYNPSDVVSDPLLLRVAKDDSAGSWLDVGGTGVGFPTGNIVSITNFFSFSKFSLSNNSGGFNALPIELNYFHAEAQRAWVNLNWETASEHNNDFFTLERSSDGELFHPFVTIDGAGDSELSILYNHVDNNPFNGLSYYRLKQTDFDGMYSYSETVAVLLDLATSIPKLTIYPNPVEAGNKLTYSYISKARGRGKLIIRNLMGNALALYEIEKPDDVLNGDITIPSYWAKGVYFISVIGDDSADSKRFVIR